MSTTHKTAFSYFWDVSLFYNASITDTVLKVLSLEMIEDQHRILHLNAKSIKKGCFGLFSLKYYRLHTQNTHVHMDTEKTENTL